MRIGMLEATTAALAALAVASTANAGIVGFVGDTTLEGGWYAFEDEFDVDMTPIIHGGAIYETVISIDVPEFNGSLDFDIGHSLRHIGYGWATWGHGYQGEVFYNNGSYGTGYDINIPNVTAFDAYIEPNPFLLHTFTITAFGSDGSTETVVRDAHGSSGAAHFGFYTTDGEALTRIEISGTSDWAMGEWRYALPAPGVLALFGLAALTRRRR